MALLLLLRLQTLHERAHLELILLVVRRLGHHKAWRNIQLAKLRALKVLLSKQRVL